MAPRIVCDRWPSLYSIASFARDIIRIEGAQCPEDVVKALFKWNTRVMRHGYGYLEGPSPAEIVRSTTLETSDQWRYGVIDPVKILHVYGEGWCDTRSRLFHALCLGAGLKSETVSVFDPKVRVWYRDDDGVDRWHFFDPFRCWYVYTRDQSRIASYADIAAEPALLTQPSKTSQPYAYTTGANRTAMFMEDGSLYPMNWHASAKLKPTDYHGMDITLRKGERLLLNWRASGKYYGIYEDFHHHHRCSRGPHSHIFDGPGTEHTTFADGDERVIDFENWPYVKNYYAPCDNPECPFYSKPVKWYGSGELTYEPALGRLEDFRDGLYSWGSYRNIATGGAQGTPLVRPDMANETAWMIFRMDTPYVIVDATIEADFVIGNSDDSCCVSISCDQGDSWREVWRSDGAGDQRLSVNIGQEPWKANQMSAVSQYAYLVRIEMTATDTARTGLNRLRLAGDLELNMFTLPILQPGRNTMQFTAVSRQADDNPRLTICWDDRDGAGRTCVRDLSGLQDDYVIETNARNPDDIRMRYLLWENPVSG